jgi:hypothetical protein
MRIKTRKANDTDSTAKDDDDDDDDNDVAKRDKL